jgi:hypothetical protein
MENRRMTDVQLFSERLNLMSPEWSADDLEFISPCWKRDGILTGTKKYDYMRCPCGEGHTENVFKRLGNDGNPEFYVRCRLTGQKQTVRHADLIGWQFSPGAFAQELRKAFPCKGDVVNILPERLWKVGSSDTPIAQRRRDIYFTPYLNRDSNAVFSQLPNTDTPLLICGSSRMENSEVFRNRVFSVYDVVGIAADQWYIDYAYMEEQLGGREHPVERPKPKIGRGLDTVAALESGLEIWIESQYKTYCECNSREREFHFERPTMAVLAGMVGKNKSTVSDALEIKLAIDKRKHNGLAVLWETAQSWDATRRYGQRHFGAPGRR